MARWSLTNTHQNSVIKYISAKISFILGHGQHSPPSALTTTSSILNLLNADIHDFTPSQTKLYERRSKMQPKETLVDHTCERSVARRGNEGGLHYPPSLPYSFPPTSILLPSSFPIVTSFPVSLILSPSHRLNRHYCFLSLLLSFPRPLPLPPSFPTTCLLSPLSCYL